MRRTCAAFAVLGLVLVTGGAWAQVSSKRTAQFDVPAQPLNKALNAFAQQSGLRIVFYTEVVEAVTSKALVGNLTPERALRTLLAGTDLKYRFTDEHTVAIDAPKSSGATAKTGVAPPSTHQGTNGDYQYAQVAASQSETRDTSTSTSISAAAQERVQVQDEVLVTAQKRVQALLDVPISMTVLGTEELEERRIKRTEDYVLSIPNASLVRGNTSNPRVSFRGIGVGRNSGKFQAIAVTLDEIGFGVSETASILQSKLFDLERIEILRGPQGTLSGSNAIGGTINFITAKPDPSGYEMNGTLDLGRFNSTFARGVINVPLSDTLAIRTAAYVEQSDGAVKNVGPAGGSSSTDNFGGRLAARWLPAESFTLDVAFSYEEQDRGMDTTLALDRDVGGTAERDASIARLAQLGGNYFNVNFIEDVGTDGGIVRRDLREGINIVDWNSTLRAAYRFGRHTIDLLYGHHEWEIDTTTDNDKSEFAAGATSEAHLDNHGTEADSVELRATSRYEGPLNWVAGLSYVDDVLSGDSHINSGDNRFAGNYTPSLLIKQYRSLQSEAAFANLFWDIGERIHLSLGGRFSRFQTKFGFACCGSGPGMPPTLVPTGAQLEEFTPRFAFNYDFSEQATAYVQFATGFRAGYGNAPAAAGRHQTSLGLIDVPAAVESERVESYELGLKGRFFEDRLYLTSAIFYMDYEDLQTFGGSVLDIPGGQFFGFDVNGGSAYAQGFEIEAALQATQRLQLRAGYGRADTNIEELVGGIREVDIPGVRPWTLTLTALYERELIGDTRAQFRADYIAQDETIIEFPDVRANNLPSFGRVDLSVGLATDRWSLTAYVENANDEIYWIGKSGDISLHGIEAEFIPRTYGLRLTVNMRE